MGKLGWMDVKSLSFNSLLLLEKMQINYLDRLNIAEEDLVIALDNNPAVEWYIRNQVERLNEWLDELKYNYNSKNIDKKRVRKAEIEVMENMNDWLVYVVDPENFADIITGGHVFGDYFDKEYNELMRVAKNGGEIILCPGNNDVDNDRHKYLVDKGFN